MMKKLKILSFIIFIVFLFFGFLMYKYYQKNYKSNVNFDSYLYIPTGSNFEEVKKRIKNKVVDYKLFVQVAENENYPTQIKPGKYKLVVGESNQELVEKLLEGNQEPVIFNFQATDDYTQLAEQIRQSVEADSTAIYSAFENQAQKDGFSEVDVIKVYFLPGTYTFFWNDKPETILNKMKQNFDEFWNDDRKNKAKELDLTPLQIINFAAITQRESNRVGEQSKIAGLYLNRFKKGMKLQSDPTVLFAKKKKEGFDKKYYRVYYADLTISSPYNTYQNVGLPPTPICSPNKEAIDAVLNAEKHEYIYMCASPTNIGYHDFTSSYAQHEENAKKYRQYLNEKNIK
jgi:UPF0755 protein